MKNYWNDQIFLVRQVPGEEPLQTFRYFVQRTDLVLQLARVKLGQLQRPTRVTLKAIEGLIKFHMISLQHLQPRPESWINRVYFGKEAAILEGMMAMQVYGQHPRKPSQAGAIEIRSNLCIQKLLSIVTQHIRKPAKSSMCSHPVARRLTQMGMRVPNLARITRAQRWNFVRPTGAFRDMKMLFHGRQVAIQTLQNKSGPA